MSRLRTATLWAVVWCVVVAVVATLVWVVIATAGQRVAPEVTPEAEVTGSLPVPGDVRPQRTSPGTTLAPRPSRRTSSPAAPATSSAAPHSSATNRPTLPSAPAKSTAPPTTPPPPAPTPQRRSWTGAAGHVVAECRGSTERLVSTFPGTGWSFTVLDRGPELVRVRFQRQGEDSYVTVSARCVAGAPSFSTSTGEPGDR
jgi:hypothetical protein